MLRSGPNEIPTSTYNSPFHMEELENILNNLVGNSPGIDNIHNDFLKHLPIEYIRKILKLYNLVFSSRIIPERWKIALIVPIQKPNKDKSEVSSYRPISLLPCIGKVMEKLIKERLYWWAETNCMLSINQSGFRKRLGVADQIARLEFQIRVALANRKWTIVVFFDLKGAYDTVDYTKLREILIDKGINGNMLHYIDDWLRNRKAAVTQGAWISDLVSVKIGLPQGSPLSPLLFNLYLSDLCVPAYANIAEYADDIAILVEGETERECHTKIQETVNRLVEQFSTKKLKINIQKTKAMVFANSKNIERLPIKIEHTQVEYVDKYKYLGVTMDSPHLNWQEHIFDTVHQGNKRANLLKAFAGRDWGADRKMLTTLYKSLVLSKLNYGAEFYSSAAQTHLIKIDKIQNNCMRLILGVEMSSPILSLEVESNIQPMKIQRDWLKLALYNRLRQLPTYLAVTQTLVKAGEMEPIQWTKKNPEPCLVGCHRLIFNYGLIIIIIKFIQDMYVQYNSSQMKYKNKIPKTDTSLKPK